MTSSAPPSRTSIDETFRNLRLKGQIALMPFVPAGFPDLETSAQTLVALEHAGANLIEVGFPFSDPIADGPTIQEAFAEALAKKLRVHDIFEMIARTRPRLSIPLVAMVSYSIVFRYGVERFLSEARYSGFNGVLLPDLPPPEAQAVCGQIQQAGLETVLLVAPTTSPQRRREIAELSSGFIYYLSVSGITGERQDLPPDIERNIRQLKDLTDRPICVGFGISTAAHVAQLAGLADGAIVGSALVKRMRQHAPGGPAATAAAAGSYCRELLAAVR